MKNINELELKELRFATDEEIEEIAKAEWKSPKMQDFIKKSYDYIITKEGYYIELEKISKYGIEKTMWYDDEGEAPEKSEANFIYYNMKNKNPMRNIEAYLEEKERLEKNGCATGMYDYNGFYIETYKEGKRAYINFYDDTTGKKIRYLSKEEEKEYIKIMKYYKEKYLERLKKYWKRYGKEHVSVNGYWANR